MAPPCGLLLALAAAAAVLAAAGARAQETCAGAAPPRRGARVSVASFGGAGDGRTLNTGAFARAVASVERLRAPGGAELYVPPGVWLTGPFNLTSRMTLFLARGAVIRATQVSATQPPSCSLHGLVRFRHCSSPLSAQAMACSSWIDIHKNGVTFFWVVDRRPDPYLRFPSSFLRSRDAIELSMTLAISRRGIRMHGSDIADML